MLKKIKKKSSEVLTKNFNSDEFDCPCNQCLFTKIDTDLIDKIQAIRDKLGRPIKITSGYRCTMYQMDLAKRGYETAKGTSQHELGRAADLLYPDMDDLLSECENNFKAVGVSKRFIHVDLRDDKARRWFYGK